MTEMYSNKCVICIENKYVYYDLYLYMEACFHHRNKKTNFSYNYKFTAHNSDLFFYRSYQSWKLMSLNH